MTFPLRAAARGPAAAAVVLVALGLLGLGLPPGADAARPRAAGSPDPYCPAELAPCDATAPRVRVRVPTQRLPTAFRRGLLVRVACSEACDIKALLLLDPRTARKLRLSRSDFPLVVGTGSGRSTGGFARVRVRLTTRRVRGALIRLRRVRLRLATFGLDPARNAGADSRRILLRR